MKSFTARARGLADAQGMVARASLVQSFLLVGLALVVLPAAADPVDSGPDGSGEPGREAPEAPGTEQLGDVSSKAPGPVVYRPPRRGSPKQKVGGGTRGTRALSEPLALAPEPALTERAAPSLFWHVDGKVGESVEVVFTLIETDASEPLVETTLPNPTAAGIRRIRLSSFGVELVPEREYEWFVSLVPSAGNRSQDVVSGASIVRLETAEPASARTPAAYAERGLWYDALETLMDRIDEDPGNRALAAERDSLLRQGGLGVATP